MEQLGMDFTKLWVDKHRPQTLGELDYNDELTATLKRLATAENLPHLIFYGPTGAGKKTRVMCLLREIYGAGVYKINKQTWSTKVKSKTIEIPLLSSRYHIDLSPCDAKKDDKLVLQKLIKETASSSQLNSEEQKSFKAIILNEAENLTRSAQAALRRTMEKYVKTCRLILICENIGNIIPALQSRCLLVRVRAPQPQEIMGILKHVNLMENVAFGQPELKSLVGENSNLRRVLLNLQNMAVRSAGGLNKNEIILDWETSVDTIVKQVMKDQSAATLKQVRCYDLFVNCIPGGEILRSMMTKFLPKFSDEYKPHLIHYAAKYDTMMKEGNKAIFFIEAFLAQVMVLALKQKEGLKMD